MEHLRLSGLLIQGYEATPYFPGKKPVCLIISQMKGFSVSHLVQFFWRLYIGTCFSQRVKTVFNGYIGLLTLTDL